MHLVELVYLVKFQVNIDNGVIHFGSHMEHIVHMCDWNIGQKK